MTGQRVLPAPWLIRRAELPGRGTFDVRCVRGRIERVGTGLLPDPGERVLDAAGGALLPGLHDHHLHLFAMAAAAVSLACGPPSVPDEPALARALRSAAPDADGWIRGVGYHESVARDLTAARIDRWRADVPIRIQHRSGSLWMLNRAGLQALGVGGAARADGTEGLERDAAGCATGRLFRADAWLRGRLGPAAPPDLGPVGAALSRVGVTGVTDATPANGPAEVAWVESARQRGALAQRVAWMGGASLPAAAPGDAARPLKLVLDERTLPTPDELAVQIGRAHGAGRPAAVHCVGRVALFVLCAAWDAAGVRPGDRVEHASVAPPEAVSWLARLGVTVVGQPGFVRDRGDDYLRDVDAIDRAWLHRCAGFDAAGVKLGGSTDAPYGCADPWRAMQAAVDRRTAAGASVSPGEGVAPERALDLFTTPAADPGGRPRTVAPGAPGDLCLLRVPWARARDALDAGFVRATFVGGERVFDADGS